MSSVVCHQFSLGEIEDATNNFEKILGSGGEAIVYFGQISEVGSVAVKRLKSNLIQFEEEIDIVSKIKHPHLVSLLGYCEESGQKNLVYEYMGKRSLSDYISKKSRSTIGLSWQQRLKICLGAARGLQHFHKGTEKLPKGIIHRDVKPDNILLDDEWVAKVSDFGLCKLSHTNQEKSTMITDLKGTGGYYAPEYLNYGNVTRKLDVYAFGVVLFQVLCCKTPWDRGDDSYYRTEDEDLGVWARENVDPDINEEISEDCLEAFTHTIGRSLQINPSKRPTMDDVVMDLEGALKCQDRQDEGTASSKAPIRGRTVSIPGSVRKTIQNIKEMNIKEISENSDDKIYAMLKKCSMNPFQTVNKLLEIGRISKATVLHYDIDKNMVSIPDFTLDELRRATCFFAYDRIILEGELGVTYKGLLDDGRTVAVKRYNLGKNQANEYRFKMGKLSTLSHPHFVSLIGKYEDSKSKLILIHEFMENGTLADYLFGDKKGVPLSWDQRLRICIDAARGLEFLHHGTSNAKRLIHGNINPENILLGKNRMAKLWEFGFLLGDAVSAISAMKTDVKGTCKYLDPYYNLTGRLTRTSDIYAFGVVLFDVLFGRMDFNGGINKKQEKLSQWTQQCLKDGSLDGIIDERLKGQISPESLKEFAELASSCVRDDPLDRPKMTEVSERLESILKTSQKTQP